MMDVVIPNHPVTAGGAMTSTAAARTAENNKAPIATLADLNAIGTAVAATAATLVLALVLALVL